MPMRGLGDPSSGRGSPSDEARDGALLRVRGLAPRHACRIAAWKVLLAARRGIDAASGFALARGRAERWRKQWRISFGAACATSLMPWSTRVGAGALWIAPRDASSWARATCTPDDLEIAEMAARGEFDVLSSGSVDLGSPPAWRTDLYSRMPWPLVPSERLPLRRNDGSDIRTVWELSRCRHFTQLARAHWTTGDARFRTAFVEHARSFIHDNPIGRGPHWKSPMDVAIRAANWALASVLFADARGIGSDFWEEYLGHLVMTGSFLERYPEWHPVFRGNHYVADHVGLVYLGALFRDTGFGAGWLGGSGRVLLHEIECQVHEDGTSFEASLAYHRLVTELFAFAGLVLRENGTLGADFAPYERRLQGMYAFIEDYLGPTGEAPLLGDADDGRLHSISAAAADEPRRHRLGLPSDWWPTESPVGGAYPAGGFYVLRSGRDQIVVRCGSVGLNGAGCHDHNDQLSFELVLDGRRIVADSGTFTYTRDLTERHRFRSTSAHSVVQLGDEEQNPIDPARPWRVLRDRTRTECTAWNPGSVATGFTGRHYGFAHRSSRAVCERSFARRDGGWHLRDVVHGTAEDLLTWRLHFADEEIAVVCSASGLHELRCNGTPAVRLIVRAPEALELSLVRSDISPRYNDRRSRALLVLRGRVALPAVIEAFFEVERASDGIEY